MNIYLAFFIVSACFLLLTIHYMTNRKLDFRYVLFWIVISILLMWLSMSPRFLDWAAGVIGVYSAPNLLFGAGLAAILAFIFYITLFISSTTRRVVRLTQEIGLLNQKIQELNENSEQQEAKHE